MMPVATSGAAAFPADRENQGAWQERLGIIGFGPIGRRIAERYTQGVEGPVLAALLVRERQVEAAAAHHPKALVCTDIDSFLRAEPDVVVECATPDALLTHAPALLGAGCDVLPLSLGAFAHPHAEKMLVEAAAKGPGRIEIPAGALGSIGFLAAARESGLSRTTITVGYPLKRWQSMGAERFADITQCQEAFTFMQASARDVALRFPGHLNVVTAAALAGAGLDETIVKLVADPEASQAWFRVDAVSQSGPVTLHIGGRDAPVDDDPLDYTTFSVIRLLKRRTAPIAI